MSPQYSHKSWRHDPHGGVGSSVSATTAIAREDVAPLRQRLVERHALRAHRQAVGRVLDVAAGDDLARVAVSSAAPTLNPEKRARACSRASTAAATSAASS